MKTTVCWLTVLLATSSVMAADSAPVDEIKAAAKSLAEEPNYSWTSTYTVPAGSQFRPGPSEGKTEKDGLTHVTMRFGDNDMQVARKGEKAAVTNRDGIWESAAELENAEDGGRFRAAMARNVTTAAAQALQLAEAAAELKKEGDVYSGQLADERAKDFIGFGRRGGGATAQNAKGSVKFWLKDGKLVKYEFSVQGTVNFNGTDRDIQRTTTVEIKDVGATKVNVPQEAQAKLS
jgi:hypothetical protein